jgi:hypothetical protein
MVHACSAALNAVLHACLFILHYFIESYRTTSGKSWR